MPNKLPLIFPPDVDYECTQCGRCCSNPWEIPLDEPAIERIRSVDWSEVRPELKDQPLVVPREMLKDEMTLQRFGEACVFLTDGNRCLIHQQRGLAFKPRACQQFPYVFTDTPAGVFVGVSFATSGIRRGEGTPLERIEERLQELANGAYHFRTVKNEVLFQPGLEITFDDALALEEGLLELLNGQDGNLEDDLVSGGIYLNMFHQFQKEEGKNRSQPGEAYLESWRRIGYQRIRDIGSKLRPSGRAQRMFLANFVTCVEAAFTPGDPFTQMLRSFAVQVKTALNLGSIHLSSLQATLPLRSHVAVKFPVDDPEVADPIRLYLRHSIFRKRLIPYCGIKTGYQLLCIYYALIRWFARARAALRQSRWVEAVDVPESIETVEQYYALHTRFDQAFEHPLLQSLLERASRKKQFLATIVRSL